MLLFVTETKIIQKKRGKIRIFSKKEKPQINTLSAAKFLSEQNNQKL
jgi:hypothetical protein